MNARRLPAGASSPPKRSRPVGHKQITLWETRRAETKHGRWQPEDFYQGARFELLATVTRSPRSTVRALWRTGVTRRSNRRYRRAQFLSREDEGLKIFFRAFEEIRTGLIAQTGAACFAPTRSRARRPNFLARGCIRPLPARALCLRDFRRHSGQSIRGVLLAAGTRSCRSIRWG
jgi:hypothetical protein